MDVELELDAGCDPDSPMKEVFSDEETPLLVLFASVIEEDEEAIQKRADEWRELFGGGATDNG